MEGKRIFHSSKGFKEEKDMGTVAIYVAGFTGEEGNRLGIAGTLHQ